VIKLPFGVEINNLIDDLRTLSWEAADVLLYYSKIIKNSEQKFNIIKNDDNEDPVTLADLKVNQLIINRIRENYHNTNWEILSEENFKTKSNNCDINSDWLWVLDPLDGTKDFIQGTANYAMHLALNYRQSPIIGVVLIPERNELWISFGQKVWCEKRKGDIKKVNLSQNNIFEEMVIVTSKNHRNEKLKQLIHQINFKKVVVMGSIGCKLASILRGESDIYISLSLPGKGGPKDWDFAAPQAILKAAGGAITDINNNDLVYGKGNLEHNGIIVASNNKEKHNVFCKKIKETIKNYSI